MSPDPQDEPTEEQRAEWAAKGHYLPSLAEIEEATRKIRAGWPAEKLERRKLRDEPVDMGRIHRILGGDDDA